MKKTIKLSLAILGIIILGVLVFLIINSISMNSMVDSEIEELITEAKNSEVKIFSYEDLEGLPEPVQRYFRYTLKDGQEYIRFAKMKTSGEFRRPNEEKTADVTADEYFTAERPAFLFDAHFANYPYIGFWVDVRDKYHHGKGDMYVNLFSGYNVLDTRGAKELDQTSFLRFIGQTVMFPTALLPSDYVRWESIDENSARIVVIDGDNSGTASVYFNEAGEITKWVTEGRYEHVNGNYRKIGTIGYRSNYREIDGVKVPMKFVIERVLSDGTREVFWKGEVIDIQFNSFLSRHRAKAMRLCKVPSIQGSAANPAGGSTQFRYAV